MLLIGKNSLRKNLRCSFKGPAIALAGDVLNNILQLVTSLVSHFVRMNETVMSSNNFSHNISELHRQMSDHRRGGSANFGWGFWHTNSLLKNVFSLPCFFATIGRHFYWAAEKNCGIEQLRHIKSALQSRENRSASARDPSKSQDRNGAVTKEHWKCPFVATWYAGG